jgi:cation diffusion facilitator family transporter
VRVIEAIRRGIRTSKLGIVVNTLLAGAKLVAGVVGHSNALVADGIESTADVFSSAVVWGGLHIAARPADEDHPYGHGKAESIAGAVVALMLLLAALAIAVQSVREILAPQQAPRPFTLAVLVGVVLVKELLFRRSARVGADTGSTAVAADAWHHRSDAITSAAAFVGISIALIGGPGWEPADDWAALVASGVIAYTGLGALRPAIHDLMDRAPSEDLLARVSTAALGVAGVRAIEKLMVRKAGIGYFVDLHVQADPAMSLDAAHVLSGMVKSAIREAVPEVSGALIHMEPYHHKSVNGENSGER